MTTPNQVLECTLTANIQIHIEMNSHRLIALPIALAYAVALVCFGNDQMMCLINQRNIELVCFSNYPRRIRQIFPGFEVDGRFD